MRAGGWYGSSAWAAGRWRPGGGRRWCCYRRRALDVPVIAKVAFTSEVDRFAWNRSAMGRLLHSGAALHRLTLKYQGASALPRPPDRRFVGVNGPFDVWAGIVFAGGAGGLEPPTPCWQNTCRLSDTVAHLGWRPHGVGRDRLVSDPVVVRFGGQLWPCRPGAPGRSAGKPETTSWPQMLGVSLQLGSPCTLGSQHERSVDSGIPEASGTQHAW
jgi:hypothetical protein